MKTEIAARQGELAQKSGIKGQQLRFDGWHRHHAALLAAVLILSVGHVTAAPILFYDFNTPGAVQTSTGSDALALTTRVGATATNKVVSSPTGPDGSSSVLGFAGAAQNTTLEGIVTGHTDFTTGLGSFTITAWVQNNTSAANERLFYLRGGSAVAIDFNLSGASGGSTQLLLSVNGSSAVGSLAGGTGTALSVPNQSSTWYFIGVTYDRIDGSVVFYSAPLGGTLASFAPTTKLTNTQVTNSSVLDIGNIAATGGGRLLNANIDDVAFYSSVLSSTEMNTAFSAVPEPGIVGLLGLASIALLTMARKRHLRH